MGANDGDSSAKQQKQLISHLRKNLYLVRCLCADEKGTFGFPLLVAVSWCRPVIRDHPIASVGLVACAVVRNLELFTGFPKPAYAEIEVSPFHFCLRECDKLTTFSLVAGILTSDETLLGDKVVKMIFRETFPQDG